MLLSETDIGRNYINQFKEKDKQIAEKFINNLIIISEQGFFTELSNNLNEIIKNQDNLPAVVYPAFEREKERKREPFFLDNGIPRMPLPEKIGSEGILQKFCRDYAKNNKGVYFNLSLNQLKEKKTRTIICVDDIIASGKRISEFIEWIYENKTIKSWYSFKWMKFLVVAYCATEKGIKNIIRRSKILKQNQIKFALQLNEGRSFWNLTDKEQISKLCYKYGEKYNIPGKWILGFENTFSTIIFPHGVPNTTPGIIWWGNNPKWHSLFPKSISPTQLISLTELQLNNEEYFLKKLGINTNGLDFNELNNDSKRLFLFLLCLSQKKRKLSIISEMIELPISYVEKARDKCINYKWITSDLILTEQGRNILKSIKKYLKQIQKNICVNESFYYPISLRGPIALSSITTSLENGGRNDC